MTKDWVNGFGLSAICQILLQIIRTVITSSPLAWTSSAGLLSTQTTSFSSIIVLQLPFFAKDGMAILCFCLGTVQY